MQITVRFLIGSFAKPPKGGIPDTTAQLIGYLFKATKIFTYILLNSQKNYSGSARPANFLRRQIVDWVNAECIVI